MSGAGAINSAGAAAAANQVLEIASQGELKQGEKLMKFAVEMAVKSPGKELGKGANFDGSF
jgi:hypothetical protein